MVIVLAEVLGVFEPWTKSKKKESKKEVMDESAVDSRPDSFSIIRSEFDGQSKPRLATHEPLGSE